MQIITMFAPLSSKCRPGRKRTDFVGVTIHNTGNGSKGAGAKSHGKYLQGGGKNTAASWHYAVDENCSVQSIPEEEVAWHAGDGQGRGNLQTIAIEICMNSDGNLLKATDNAAELAADILRRNNIVNAAGWLWQHNNWSGKNCPQMIRAGKPYNWKEFVNRVQAHLDKREEPELTQEKFNEMMENYLKMKGEEPSASWAQDKWDKATAAGIFDGSRPQGPFTRQEAAVVLDRLRLVK